jgi:hypothetical protein
VLSYSLSNFKISRIAFSPDAPYHTLGNCVLSISLNHQSFVHSPKFSRLLERTYHFPPGHVMCELLHFIYTKFATHHQLLPRDVSDQSLPQFLCRNFIPFWLTSSIQVKPLPTLKSKTFISKGTSSFPLHVGQFSPSFGMQNTYNIKPISDIWTWTEEEEHYLLTLLFFNMFLQTR